MEASFEWECLEGTIYWDAQCRDREYKKLTWGKHYKDPQQKPYNQGTSAASWTGRTSL
jgi:hypothetical protein